MKIDHWCTSLFAWEQVGGWDTKRRNVRTWWLVLRMPGNKREGMFGRGSITVRMKVTATYHLTTEIKNPGTQTQFNSNPSSVSLYPELATASFSSLKKHISFPAWCWLKLYPNHRYSGSHWHVGCKYSSTNCVERRQLGHDRKFS